MAPAAAQLSPVFQLARSCAWFRRAASRLDDRGAGRIICTASPRPRPRPLLPRPPSYRAIALRYSSTMASAPVSRDFEPRDRAGTRSGDTPRPFSIEIDADPNPGNIVSNAAPDASGGLRATGRPSIDDGFGPIRRMTRSNTVRTYSSTARPHWEEPGAEPGIDPTAQNSRLDHLQARCQITAVDFTPSKLKVTELDNEGLIAYLDEPRDSPGISCRWLNVNGLSGDVIGALGKKYKLHRLAIEDLLNTRGRTKTDWYSDHAFSQFLDDRTGDV